MAACIITCPLNPQRTTFLDLRPCVFCLMHARCDTALRTTPPPPGCSFEIKTNGHPWLSPRGFALMTAVGRTDALVQSPDGRVDLDSSEPLSVLEAASLIPMQTYVFLQRAA